MYFMQMGLNYVCFVDVYYVTCNNLLDSIFLYTSSKSPRNPQYSLQHWLRVNITKLWWKLWLALSKYLKSLLKTSSPLQINELNSAYSLPPPYLNGYFIPGEHLVLCNLRWLPGGASPSLWEASTDFEVCVADDKYANVSRGDSTKQIAVWGESATHRFICGEKGRRERQEEASCCW